MKSRTDMRRIASRTTGIAAVVVGAGSGLAWLLAPLVSPPRLDAASSHVRATDASAPLILAAFALAGIGFALLRRGRRP